MANTIKIKRAASSSSSAPSLAEGELGHNEYSKLLYIGTSGGNIQVIGGNTDVTKLATIETNADVTDTANVTSAGALMDSELAGLAAVKATTGTFLTADQTKLDGIAASANNYSLPVASSTVSGGIKVGANLTITGGVLASASSYSHPTHPGDDLSVDTTALTGATVVSDIDINVTTDTLGHVTDANGTVSTRELSLGDLGYTGATDANNYSLPTATSSVLGGVKNGAGITNTAGVLSVSTAYLASGHDASNVTSSKITNWDNAYSWYNTMTTADGDSVIDTVTEIVAAFENHAEGLNLITELDAKLTASSTIDGGTF
jgi:hypothetical protein